MSDIKAVEAYFQALEGLEKIFGSTVNFYSIESHLNKFWQASSFTLNYSDNHPSKEEEWTYSEEIYNDNIFRSESFTLVVVDTCTIYGKVALVFSNEKELPDWEFEWE